MALSCSFLTKDIKDIGSCDSFMFIVEINIKVDQIRAGETHVVSRKRTKINAEIDFLKLERCAKQDFVFVEAF